MKLFERVSKDIIRIGKNITIYGNNEMHYAIRIHTKRYGYITFRPSTGRGRYPWYFMCSPNGTPWAATYAVGPGISVYDRCRAPIRKRTFGHNFDAQNRFNYKELCVINGISPDD